jgi:hypothetical protein
LTEIVGESASGKTQLCLQLCLVVQLPVKYGGLNGGESYLYHSPFKWSSYDLMWFLDPINKKSYPNLNPRAYHSLGLSSLSDPRTDLLPVILHSVPRTTVHLYRLMHVKQEIQIEIITD